MTKKEIVKKISEDIGLTQLKTKDIVQRTLDAIIQTLVSEGRIELRNFGVFEVKRRAPRKARNPRTGDKVYVPSKNVVTFKPGKEMEELVRKMNPENLPLLEDDADADVENNGPVEPVDRTAGAVARRGRRGRLSGSAGRRASAPPSPCDDGPTQSPVVIGLPAVGGRRGPVGSNGLWLVPRAVPRRRVPRIRPARRTARPDLIRAVTEGGRIPE